jgi:hypothetical protein
MLLATRQCREVAQQWSRATISGCALVFVLWFAPALLPGTAVRQQSGAATDFGQLYLLAATPTEHSPATAYPVTLYRLGADGKLKTVREIVDQADGARIIQSWKNVVFVIYPHLVSTTVSILHIDDPLRVDEITFNPKAFIPADSAVTIAELSGSVMEQLVPLMTNAEDTANHPVPLVSVRASSATRLETDNWDDYSKLRREGDTGGPALVAGLIARVRARDLVVSVFAHSTVIDSLPEGWSTAIANEMPLIIAANRSYLIFMTQHKGAGSTEDSSDDWQDVFIHNRGTDRWTRMRLEGSVSASRFFEPWLATQIGVWNPQHHPSPGRENERSGGGSTGRSADTRGMYTQLRGRWVWSPGTLLLRNLSDGRKLRIQTGQEDSEILRVESDALFYRVNDTIFQAKIVGDQLQDTTVIVKGEDVPEIHWVFWSR